MSKILTAEYDAAHNMLHLSEPLEGVSDHETVKVQVTVPAPQNAAPENGLFALQGLMSEEQADEMKAILNEMFPPWND
jgi:hypothetical protein